MKYPILGWQYCLHHGLGRVWIALDPQNWGILVAGLIVLGLGAYGYIVNIRGGR